VKIPLKKIENNFVNFKDAILAEIGLNSSWEKQVVKLKLSVNFTKLIDLP